MSFASAALIGLGEVGQILAVDLAAAGLCDITAHDVLFADDASKPSTSIVPVRKCASAAEAVAGKALVFSAVTAASDLDAARAVAAAIAPGAFFLDLNSVSPGQKQKAAAAINGAGGRYVEAAVMTPFPSKRIASPMLLGGPHAADFLKQAAGLGLSAKVFSPDYGKASATKMCRSVIIKGVEALVTESLLSARHYGVEADVLGSLSDLLPVGDWNRLATYLIGRSLEHGKRRAEEMREVAATVAEAGVEPLMTRACVERQEWAAKHRGMEGVTLAETLDRILEQKQQ
jgi:3-hydroxyisobutyrate dehydrogenase-like beta-hydroxyacid dehydrogenase